MNKEIAEKWMTALRSGEYKQITGRLYDGKGYCCLGVLCKIIEKDFTYLGIDAGYAVDGSLGSLPDSVMIEIECQSGHYMMYGPRYGKSDSDSLVSDNDRGKTFDEIADIIEKNYEKL